VSFVALWFNLPGRFGRYFRKLMNAAPAIAATRPKISRPSRTDGQSDASTQAPGYPDSFSSWMGDSAGTGGVRSFSGNHHEAEFQQPEEDVRRPDMIREAEQPR
jgi:hypothetical protein